MIPTVPPAPAPPPGARSRAPAPHRRRCDPAAAAAALAQHEGRKEGQDAGEGGGGGGGSDDSDDDWAPAGEGSRGGVPDAVGARGAAAGISHIPLEDLEIPSSELVLREIVGNGITADVFRGLWRGKVVAIKQIDDKRFRMHIKEQITFTREIAILRKVSHDNLVRMFGVSFTERPFRIITEFCQGGDLFKLLHGCLEVTLVWTQQLKMCCDVASAMNYLHKFTPQIIHRDLKSLNLLLGEPVLSSNDVPCVKVSDFGLARMKDDQGPDADWGKMTVGAGTRHWMAPEVFEGSSYDEKVDVYSYAMVLYEVICREVPFEEEDPANVGRLVVEGSRPDLEAVPVDCPEALRRLMVQCWAHDSRERPSFERIVYELTGISPPRSTGRRM